MWGYGKSEIYENPTGPIPVNKLLINISILSSIDTNLKTSPGYDLDTNIYLSDSILEFKYLPKYENYFRNFFKEIESGLRAVKYSKYVRSFFELNNSGLIK